MEAKITVQGIVSKNTIVLHPSQGQPINVSKDTNEILFAEVADLLENGTSEQIVEKFLDIKGKVERYSLNLFTVDQEKGLMYLKGTENPMPELMVDKLLELEEKGEDFMPLIRFWKRLQKNPSQASIEQLYGFMVHNGIGISELGEIIVEKGVGVANGKLVDAYTGQIDNSIGEVVEMDRTKVDDDPQVTCSYGLHVGAPDYVRQFYSQNVIIRCSVDPADVVAVPTDYKNTKMRVCKYTVLGYAEDKTTHKPVFKLSDFVTKPSEEVQRKLDNSLPKPVVEEDEVDEPWVDSDEFEEDEWEESTNIEVNEPEEVKAEPDAEYITLAEEMLKQQTGKQILDFVEKETGVRMPYSDKSKATLVKRGAELLAKHLETLDNK